MTTRLIILLLLGSLKCVAQNQFNKSTRWALSFEARGYYDSGQYNFFKLGQAKSTNINLDVQKNLTPKLSWNNELQIVKFYPNKKERNVLDVAGLATKLKGYCYNNDETYEGNARLFNPYAQYGFQFTNIITEPSKQFVSMVASVGTEMKLHRLKRGFMQVNYSLGYGPKALSYLSFQYGVSYNFEEKKREVAHFRNQETEYELGRLKLEFENYRIRTIQDSIDRTGKLKYRNNEMQENKELTDSLSNKILYLAYDLKVCSNKYNWTRDSLDAATQILNSIYLKQWQNFEWIAQDSLLKSKNGYFAMVLQSYDMDEIMANKNAASLPLQFAIIQNKYKAYRLLYLVGFELNSNFDKILEKVLEQFPTAELLKFEDF